MKSRILVVEDDDLLRQMLTDVLSEEGYEVDQACNGLDALQKIDVDAPDAIMLDMMMPVMDGQTFLEECGHKAQCECLPILVMSAYTGMLDGQRRPNVKGSIEKPFDLDDLIEWVGKIAPLAA